MSKPSARRPVVTVSGYQTSTVRVAVAITLAILGVAWVTAYVLLAKDAANYLPGLGGKKPNDPLPWMSDLGKWNYLIGFTLFLLGLVVSAHRHTPLGRGRAVIMGMLGCFLFGLVWIVVYYFIPDGGPVPVMNDLRQYNLLVGLAFMAVGFFFATKWE